MKRSVFGLTVFVFLLSACGPTAAPTSPGNPVSTLVGATMQSGDVPSPMPTGASVTIIPPTAAPPTQTPFSIEISGSAITFQNVSFNIPVGLAQGATGTLIPKTDGANVAPWEIAPEHIKFIFNDYPLSNTFFSPEVLIYPADEFSQTGENIAGQINALRDILNSQGAPLPNHLPFLPPINAGQVFYAQADFLNFRNGSGIRYITQFDQAPLAINNQEIFYTYQALSTDGNYFVVVTMPINAPFLVADNNPVSVTPPDGIALNYNDFSAFPQYVNDLATKLNSTAPEVFTPSLTQLDALIQSITITGQ